MAAPAGCRFWGSLATVLGGFLVLPALGAEPSRDAQAGPSAEALVRDALKAEAAGKPAEREKLLRMALEKDPDYAPARWHSGYVRVGKEWRRWEEVQRLAASDPRIAEYRRRFEEQAGTPGGELTLARWCRDQGLEDHARFHWLRLLVSQPQNEEALRALGMRWHQGQLLTHEQIVAKRQAQNPQSRPEQRATKDWTKHWTPRVSKWQRVIQEDKAALASAIREELEALRKSSADDLWAAVRGLDAVLVVRSQWRKDADEYRTLSLKWIETLDSMPERQAAFSLARLAVDHPMPEVRIAAADALKKRPRQSYVGLLIARMQAPIEARFTFVALPMGGGIYEQSLYREGVDADYEQVYSHSVLAGGAPPAPNSLPPPPNYQQTVISQSRDFANSRVQRAQDRANMAKATMRAGAIAAAKSTDTQRRVELVNAGIVETNERVRAALSRATGEDLGVNPRPWFDWWVATSADYFDVERSSQTYESRPFLQYYAYDTECTYTSPRTPKSYDPPPPRPKPPRPTEPSPHHDWHFWEPTWSWVCCFPRGTTVWTLTGPMPIEQVKLGDRVLSQHPVTGELAYKPVIETTTRKPESLTRISLGSDVIAATRGHAFLAAEEGWRMAKQLKVGMRLHGLSGSVMIDGIEEVTELKPFYERLAEKPDADAGDDLTYNLIVDESHTYFVGRCRVLVFDGWFAALANRVQNPLASAK